MLREGNCYADYLAKMGARSDTSLEIGQMLTQQPMLPSPLSLRGFFFLCPKFYSFPCKFKFTHQFFPKPICKDHKLLRGKLISAAFSNAALNYAHGYDELPERENKGDASGFDFLHFMEERGVRANSQTYLWLLEGCLNSGSFSDGWKLHGKILKMGFCAELVLCDRLVDLYIAFGDLDGAVKVFDDMPVRPLSCWNKIMHRFVAEKLTGHVLGLFQRMMKENVKPDERTFAGVLRGCSGNAVPFHYVEQIHARTITHGFESSPFICNPLIDLYFKNSFLNSAKKVFDNLHDRDSVSWVAMLSGLSQSGYEEEAIILFCQMHTSGISPTPYIFSSVLSACTKIEFFELGEQLHGLVLKQGFSSETYVCNALVTLYSRMGNLISAEQVFSAMSQRDGVSYNSLISGLAQQGYSDRALKLYKKMHLDCLKPDCVTVASLLSACASAGALLIGKQFHSYAIKAGMSSDLILEGSLLDLYVKCSDIKTAHDFFLASETENVVLWNVMLAAYGQLDNLNESFQIFTQMQIEGIVPNQFTYPSIQALDQGQQIHAQSCVSGYSDDLSIGNALVSLYARFLCLLVVLIPGAAATEIELAKRVKDFSFKETGLDQYAIAKFAESFEMIPRTLADNAGLNAMEITSSLYAKVGIDLEGVCKDVLTMRVWDLHVTKFFALKYAADATCTVLRVYQVIN
ncbi:Tetratricopeptide-like helical domain superfamily [Sesbania bispinosa]|nr:Tetratricopeptide-like helical domain superfamily [Sesbania bispinosa]